MKLKYIMVALLLTFCLSQPILLGCEKKGKTVFIPLEEKQDFGITQETSAYPRPEGKTKKLIRVINLNSAENVDIMFGVTLQGNVNRKDPDMYLLSRYIVQGFPSFNSTQFWLDSLDLSYTGENAFERKEYADLYELVIDYMKESPDLLKGVVLYHDRIVQADPMSTQGNNRNIYSDTAILNLTVMLAGQLNAIALTPLQYSTLKSRFKAGGISEDQLPVLSDTREFMSRTALEGGEYEYDENRGNRAVWAKVYRYALDEHKSGRLHFSSQATAHNPNFQAAWFDYVVAQKMFSYNRILMTEATELETAIENEIMALTHTNTPVMGVWYLSVDEAPYVSYLTSKGKYFSVTHETFNLSWSSGLSRVLPKTQEPKLEYDPNKVYLAMTLSETDNNSYTNYKMFQTSQYNSPRRGEFAMTWALNAAVADLNPNIIAYMNVTNRTGDGIAIGESGVGYVDPQPSLSTSKEFFALSDLYCERLGSGNMRTLRQEIAGGLNYITNMENVDSMLLGYAAAGNHAYGGYHTGDANFLFRGVPVFRQFTGDDMQSLLNMNAQNGDFFSLSFSGWTTDLEDVANFVERLPANFQTVSQSQLADLYRQKMKNEFEQVTFADFDAPMTVQEMGFLYHSDDYNRVDTFSGDKKRFGYNKNYVVYTFDLADTAKAVSLNLTLGGEYVLRLSTDCKNWTTVLTNTDISRKKENVKLEIPEKLWGEKVFLMISDPTLETGGGYEFYHATLTTNQSAVSCPLSFNGNTDGAFYKKGGKVGEGGLRTGEAVYVIPFAESVREAMLSIRTEGESSVAISADGKNFYSQSTTRDFDTTTTRLDSLVSPMYLKISSTSPVQNITLTPIVQTSSFAFSPVGNEFDRAHRYIGDELSEKLDTIHSYTTIKNDETLGYVFHMKKGIEEATLSARINGNFKLQLSVDGQTFDTLYDTSLNGLSEGEQEFDVSKYAKNGGTILIKITKSKTGANANVLSLGMELSFGGEK